LPPATRGAAAKPTNAAAIIARFINTLDLLDCVLRPIIALQACR
jgi:hypothetical protein